MTLKTGGGRARIGIREMSGLGAFCGPPRLSRSAWCGRRGPGPEIEEREDVASGYTAGRPRRAA